MESDREKIKKIGCIHFTTTFEFEYGYGYPYLWFSGYEYRIIQIPFPYFHPYLCAWRQGQRRCAPRVAVVVGLVRYRRCVLLPAISRVVDLLPWRSRVPSRSSHHTGAPEQASSQAQAWGENGLREERMACIMRRERKWCDCWEQSVV
jgi:hypothetical protein